MASTFLGFSTTAASNTDVNGVSIQGTAPVSNFDGAMREGWAILRRDVDGRVVLTSKSANYTAVSNDNNAIIRFSAAATLSLTAAATLGSGWHAEIVANGGDVVIDPNASETIDGRTTLTVRDGSSVVVICDGSNFRTNLQADQRAPKGHISGLTISNDATDPTNDINIAPGEAASDGTIPYLMIVGAFITKRLDAAWAVGSGNGGLDTGTIANTTYHVWVIQRSDTGVVDALFSTSATSPTMPSGYDRKRRIGAFVRRSGVIEPFIQLSRSRFEYKSAITDRSSTSALSSTLIALSVPTGVSVRPILVSLLSTNSASSYNISNSIGGSYSGSTGASTSYQQIVGNAANSDLDRIVLDGFVVTDTSAQIYFAVTINSGTIAQNVLSTKGFIDDSL